MIDRFEYRWKRMLAYFGLNMRDVSEITGLSHQTIKQYASYGYKGFEDSINTFERLTNEGTVLQKEEFEFPKNTINPGINNLETAIREVLNNGTV